MKFPESWLREWIDPPVDSAALAEALTQGGIEVEAMGPALPAFDGVVVAEILEASPHPNAEKLRVCRVSQGTQELQIVCGAPNARAGIKVPLAQVGATLPDGLHIKKAALRGVDSAGMLCSARELGLTAQTEGLLELASDAPLGRSLREWLRADEAVFELKLTPNRADCLSIRGLAFEVAAEHGLSVTEPASAQVALTSSLFREAKTLVPSACPRYLGRVIEGLDLTRTTPAWMRERLERSGLRAINLGVDITNYVMLELGQPLHAFDDERLQGDLRVRWAQPGERLTLLDTTEITLSEDMLVIADDAGAQAMAGVMGGSASKTHPHTTRLFLECAHFAPSAVMGVARRLGLSSDAAYRFERGVDPELPERALERATALYVELAGGKAGPISRAQSAIDLRQAKPLVLRLTRVAALLGHPVSTLRAKEILSALGMTVVELDPETLQVTPPLRRFDIAIEEDLIEEIARIVGYGAIPNAALRGTFSQPELNESQRATSSVREQLVALGFQEAITFSFVSDDALKKCGLDPMDALALKNPLSADLARMRTSLLPGLLAALAFNLNRQTERVRLFEIGRSFSADGQLEPLKVSGVISGLAEPEQWGRPKRALDFFDIKGVVEQLLPAFASFDCSASGVAWLHPGQSATLRDGEQIVGHFGALHPQVATRFDLRGSAFGFELNASYVLAQRIPRARAVSKFPSIRRDLAFTVARDLPFEALESAVREAAGGKLQSLTVFDVYVESERDSACKSIAMGLILQDDSATLHDIVINETVGAVVANVVLRCSAVLRG